MSLPRDLDARLGTSGRSFANGDAMPHANWHVGVVDVHFMSSSGFGQMKALYFNRGTGGLGFQFQCT